MKKGFTIIELVVSMGIFAMLVPLLFLVFFSTITLYTQNSALQKVKNQGDYMRTTIINKIRNTATGIIPDCQLTISEMGGSPCFQSTIDKIYFGYKTDSSGNIYYYENNNYPTVTSATNISLLLDAATNTDFPLRSRNVGNLITHVTPNNRTVILSYIIDFVPKTKISVAQSLSYTFYVTLRQ
ncbi:MAG: prepilin-type N-terminal cleavage/methylation domain-containing protein [Candidatus Roizmanbacteria bacterium]|nr:prepilin-type N-terminal cleavage/methylation domain-containing protein [Candidatus Roizmanbacteria bacterium]